MTYENIKLHDDELKLPPLIVDSKAAVVPMIAYIEPGITEATQVIKLPEVVLVSGNVEESLHASLPELLSKSDNKVFIGKDNTGIEQVGIRFWGELFGFKFTRTFWAAINPETPETFIDRVTKKVTKEVDTELHYASAKAQLSKGTEDYAARSILCKTIFVGITAPGHGGYYENLWPAHARRELTIP